MIGALVHRNLWPPIPLRAMSSRLQRPNGSQRTISKHVIRPAPHARFRQAKR